jgi:predicted ATPase/DNA-binding CsgD family transcriptional regulator
VTADHPDLAASSVTEREHEVLTLLAEHLQNREIAQRLFISERTVESHVSSLLRKLGCKDRRALARKAEALLDPPARTTLPLPLSTFVGRELETAQLRELACARRLVTIVGPAGCGKTRLAVEVASSGALDGSVVYADLAPLPAGSDVQVAFSDALGMQPAADARESVVEALSEGPTWLVIDNCEHVRESLAPLLTEVLTQNGELRALATSQAPLRVATETLFELTPLAVPPADVVVDERVLLDTAAGRLFVERATAVAPGFAVGADAEAIAEICRRLDGLPLAVELAAARIRHFSPVELVALLDNRFALLRTPAHGSGARQLTLEESLAWSYDLLDADEQLLLDRCAIFPREFDFAALVAIVSGGPLDTDRVTALFPRLLDRSLVDRRRDDDTSRYRLLESVRAYASARLADRNEAAAVRERYADHFLAEAGRRAPELRGPRQVEALAWFDREWGNLRTAVQLRLEDPAHHPDVWGLMGRIGFGWEVLGARADAFGWIRQLLTHRPPSGPHAAAALASAAQVMWYQDIALADSLVKQAREAVDPADALGSAHVALIEAITMLILGQPDAVPALRVAADLSRQAGDPWIEAYALIELGRSRTDLTEAADLVTEGNSLLAGLGDAVIRSNALFGLAFIAIIQKVRPLDAAAWLEDAAALARRCRSHHELLHARLGLALLAHHPDLEPDAQELRRLADEFRRMGDLRCVARAKIGLALACRASGQVEEARRLQDAASSILRAIGDPRTLAWLEAELG